MVAVVAKGWSVAKRYQLTRVRRIINRVSRLLIRTRFAPSGYYELTTTGRRSGAQRTTPVHLLERDGHRWLVAPYGPVAWVHNIRASGEATIRRRGKVERVRATEVDAATAAPVLHEYVRAERIVRPSPGTPTASTLPPAVLLKLPPRPARPPHARRRRMEAREEARGLAHAVRQDPRRRTRRVRERRGQVSPYPVPRPSPGRREGRARPRAARRPTGRRVRLTSAAHRLLRHAHGLYAQWELARADLAAAESGESGEVRLCGFPTALASLLTPAAARLRQAHPRPGPRRAPTPPHGCRRPGVSAVAAGDQTREVTGW